MPEREAVQAYPLQWPAGWKRSTARKHGKFTAQSTNYRSGNAVKETRWLTVADGLARVNESLARMKVESWNVVVSTNMPLRLDGRPRSGEKEPSDPGVAVYWRKGDGPMSCMAIDQYRTVADNLGAIAATLEAMRAIERHGGAEILNRAFSGFKQLAAENEGLSWWGVLQVRAGATVEEIEAAFRTLAKIAHPDAATGSHEAMSALNAAREQGLSVARGRG